ncbi:MAG: amidohydrolase family protein, partial [Rhodobacterales bacterium]|nr:amidohydrolase family protein [Rhodobacterales bacterium]MDX5412496.1 amidohydrolase family protein [Rhodobacterales bacterium]
DSHTHGLWGACRDLLEVFTGLGSTHAQLCDAIAARVPQVQPGHWLVAGPWQAHLRAELGPRPADILDRLAPGVKVVVKDVTQHSVWVSSAAMKDAGITAATPDPEGGEIERDASGNPTGILREMAIALVAHGLTHPADQAARAVRHMVARFHGWGLTGFKEPMAMESDLIAYAQAHDEGALTLHTGAHLSRQSPFGPDMTPMATLADWRKRYARAGLHTGFAKLFLDGVAPSRTAAFTEAYLGTDPAAHDPEAMLLLKPDVLAAEVTALDAAGFTVKMHAVGDRAVQAALDGIAAARATNGDSGLRHEVAHCPFIRPQDLRRFAELGAVAEVSPKLWFPGPVTSGQRAALGEERTDRCHPIGDLLRAGAEVIYGSDWPAAAADANPWTGLAGMISRTDPTGRYPGILGAAQAIPLDAALPLFTVNGARALGLPSETGAIRAGLSADLVVFRGDIDAMSPAEIGAVEPHATLFRGRVVHGAL